MKNTHHSIKHHLISLPVLDLVVQVLRQIQTLVNVLLKPDGALQGEKEKKQSGNNYNKKHLV